jgi:hypothetical protein
MADRQRTCGQPTCWLAVCLILVALATILATYGYATVGVLKASMSNPTLEATLSRLRNQLVKLDLHLTETTESDPRYLERRKELLLQIEDLKVELEARSELLDELVNESNSSWRKSASTEQMHETESSEWCQSEDHMTVSRKPLPPDFTLPKVYVYDLPGRFNKDMARKFSRCSTDQYGTEVWFHEAFLQVQSTA